ncbi:MAG TPA: hypothetical protein VHZ24_19025 [Pirellulales bacterium]|jgi:tyrosine-protein phosphatase SIW14|nr:hypothetical protein [Pirellulales bacterium]
MSRVLSKLVARRLLVFVGAVLAVIGLGWGGYRTFWTYHTKRFQVLREGVLYRTGQPTELGLRHLVRDLDIRTVVSLQLSDFRLYRGWLDLGAPDGQCEAEFTTQLGARHVQLPMGEEACWPWPTPWQLESFLALLDEPANLPVLIHCMGGRHRTGTLAALYRMEYDRWPAERAIAEMRSFDFPDSVAVQDHNLRTYLPRPHPTATEWEALDTAFAPLLQADRPRHYEELVRDLRAMKDHTALIELIVEYLRTGRPFGLPLAVRLIDSTDDPLAIPATDAAESVVGIRDGSVADWQMAAALIADFGSDRQQQLLESILREEMREARVSLRYAALVAGVTNRYRRNRITYLNVLLDDERQRVEPVASDYRYCDTAVARLESITDHLLACGTPSRATWDRARLAARNWLAENPALVARSRLVPPDGNKTVRAGEVSREEDLSRLK